MKIDTLPFKIGMHYENWEFDLLVEELSETYEMYRYVKGDIKSFEAFEVTDVFLYFKLDILFQVEVYLEPSDSFFVGFHKVENGLSIRARLIDRPKLIELTYNKHRIWHKI